GTFSDPDTGDTVTVTASVGSISQTGGQSGSWSWSFNSSDESQSQTVIITATDNHGVSSTTSFALVVNDALPTVSVDNNFVTAAENASASNTGTFADFDDAVTITASTGALS